MSVDDEIEALRRERDALREQTQRLERQLAQATRKLVQLDKFARANDEMQARVLGELNELSDRLIEEKRKLEASTAGLAAANALLRQELAAAARYVRSLLPEPRPAPIATDWRFLPCAELGGDAFGYHEVDDGAFAVYLLDVCGHGLGPALHATSVLGVLRAERFGGIDYRSPSAVLTALNHVFPIARHDGAYFTIWYGVYDRDARQLRFASSGHPPALLVSAGGSIELGTDNPLLGVDAQVVFDEDACDIGDGDVLYVFSDGAYEIIRAGGTMASYEDLRALLEAHGSPSTPLDQLLTLLRQGAASPEPDDDLSLVRVVFGDPGPSGRLSR